MRLIERPKPLQRIDFSDGSEDMILKRHSIAVFPDSELMLQRHNPRQFRPFPQQPYCSPQPHRLLYVRHERCSDFCEKGTSTTIVRRYE
jgi:hypothetical protein